MFLMKSKKEIIDNEYKVMTNFSDVDFSCYEEFAKISSKELKISRKKIAADDEGCRSKLVIWNSMEKSLIRQTLRQ